jgi:nitrogen fixation NifU-like protein
VSFEGRGCAISTASASLMTEILTGKTLAEAEALFKNFHAKVTSGAVSELPEALEEDGDRLEPLTGVKTYPARVKCATLAWHAFEAALQTGRIEGATVKTE